MQDVKRRRTGVLLRWRGALAENGESDLPSRADLRRIGAAGYCWPSGVDLTVLEPWRAHLEFLFEKIAADVVDPVDELRASALWLRRSASPGGSAPVAGSDGIGEVRELLQQWYAEATGRPGIGSVRNSDLAQIARSRARSAEQIQAMLPEEAAPLAEEIAELLAVAGAAGQATESPAHHNGARPAAGAAESPGSTTGPEPAQAADHDLRFAPLDHGAASGPAERVEVRLGASGLVLIWAERANPGGAVIYRVGSSDECAPYSPDAADRIAVTDQCRAVDARDFANAVRHVRVWAHSGATREEASQNPPVLHATATVVAPVRDVQIRQDEARVVGQWTTPPGAEFVQVLRVPADPAARGAGDPRYRILAEQSNLAGFDDSGAEPGCQYLYQFSTAALVDGVRMMSLPVDREITVAAVLSAVPDLSVVLHEGPDPEMELSWGAPPGGRAVLYRTESPPQPGSDRAAMAEGALAQAGLPVSARLLHPVEPADSNRVRMQRVSWPQGWMRAWFTPVTVLDGRARIGATVCVTRVGVVRSPRIVERTNKQVVTFGWPPGAVGVRMYRGVPGQDPRTATTGRCEEILYGQYQRAGGLHLSEDPLPSRGCSVHLVAVARFEGQPVLGAPVSLNYPGLLRMRYSVTAKRSFTGKLTRLMLRLESQLELTSPPAFVLVHHPDRLPLHIYDGRVLAVRAAWDGTATPSARFVPPKLSQSNAEMAWTADVRGLSGYVRLFVDVDESRRALVALTDPPVADLRLLPNATRWLG